MAQDIIQAQHNWMKMSSIVDMACHRLGLSVNHYFRFLLEVAIWETIQLKLDRANEPRTVLLPISDVNTVQIPPDAIDWTKVGTPYGQYVKTIAINGDLSKIDRTVGNPEFSYSISPGWLPNGTAIQEYGGGFEFLNYGGRSIYAIGGGLPHEGHFQVVKRSGYMEILLDGNIASDQIYLEYIGIGINPCGETVLDPYIADYILKAIMYAWERDRNPKKIMSMIQLRGQEMAHAKSLVSGRTNSIDPDTLLAITRKAYRLTNKA